jgi:hypothetical protein
MATRATPTESTAGASNKLKRKHQSVDTVENICEIIVSINTPGGNYVLKDEVTKMTAVLLESDAISPLKKVRLGMKVTPIPRQGIVPLLGFDYNKRDDSFIWKEPDEPEIQLSNDASMLYIHPYLL